MGDIQKQSINSTIFTFAGFAIGALNLLVLFPKFLTQNELGLTRAMMDISITLTSLCTLGSITVIYKFYPFYKDYLEEKKNDLPMVTAAVCLTGYSLVIITGYLLRELIIRKLGKSPEFATYFYTVYLFTFFLLIFTWLEAFAWSTKKTVVANFLKETVVRLITTVLILLYGLHLVSIKSFINLFSLVYLVPAVALIVILARSGKWRFSFTSISSVTRRFKKRMVSFGLFVFGAQFLNVLSRTNDSILIIGLRGLADTGVFAIANYIIAVMEIPQRSLNAISVPILAEAWKSKDHRKINNIYTKSVSNLLVIGLGLFGLLFLNVHDIVVFLGKDYAQIKIIVFLMGIAKVLDLGTGINSFIIGTSNYWKFDFYTNVIYTIFSIPLNFFLIKYFGLTGLAISSLISLTIFNTIRFIFIYRKFGFQPYTSKSALALLLAGICYVLVYNIPQAGNIFVDATIRSLVFILIFVPPMYLFKIAPDLNAIFLSRMNKLLRRNH